VAWVASGGTIMMGCDEVRKRWSMVQLGVGLRGTSMAKEGHGTTWLEHDMVGGRPRRSKKGAIYCAFGKIENKCYMCR